MCRCVGLTHDIDIHYFVLLALICIFIVYCWASGKKRKYSIVCIPVGTSCPKCTLKWLFVSDV